MLEVLYTYMGYDLEQFLEVGVAVLFLCFSHGYFMQNYVYVISVVKDILEVEWQ